LEAAAVDALDPNGRPADPGRGGDPEPGQAAAPAQRGALKAPREGGERAQLAEQRLTGRGVILKEGRQRPSAAPAGSGIQLAQHRVVTFPLDRPEGVAVPEKVRRPHRQGAVTRVQGPAARDPAAVGQQEGEPTRAVVLLPPGGHVAGGKPFLGCR
jgi:hypothetical protein